MNLFTTAEAIKDQRERGWPDFHPERFCHRCFGRNLEAWYVDNPLWNATELRKTEIVCPQCFVELHEKATGRSVPWQLRPHQYPEGSLVDAVLAILQGNPHASKEFLAYRIAVEVEDRAALITDGEV